MDAIHTEAEARPVDEDARHDRGVVFLLGMAVLALAAVFGSLSVTDSPSSPGSTQAQVTAR